MVIWANRRIEQQSRYALVDVSLRRRGKAMDFARQLAQMGRMADKEGDSADRFQVYTGRATRNNLEYLPSPTQHKCAHILRLL